jgi:protein-S-isoprenylcysteine O-methyltransferase Ste14
MTESASTPRLRATFAIYLALIVATAVIGPQGIPAAWHYLTGLLGFTFVAVACLGRIWCSLFIAGHKDELLITTGPYALCRHPLYSLSVLGALGLGLTSGSVILCSLVVMLIAALVIYAASCEEQFLADSFPDQFKAYLAATPNKWLPRFQRTPLPAVLDVRPAVFWKAFLDAGSFFVLWVLVAMAAEFRAFHTF